VHITVVAGGEILLDNEVADRTGLSPFKLVLDALLTEWIHRSVASRVPIVKAILRSSACAGN
jgi:hypothetical protein